MIQKHVATLKQAFRARRTSNNPAVRYALAVMTAAHRTGLFLLDREHRSVVLLKLFKRESVHQTTPLTSMDRYPEIVSTCRAYFADRKNLKILSYGCSTGEEVITLRKYFPLASITGAELVFGLFRRRERGHFPFGSRYGAEFLYCLGLAGT